MKLDRQRVEQALLALTRRGRLQREDLIDLFGASQRLIVYGSLVPGGSNHHELAGLEGTWYRGVVTGSLQQSGWGAAAGYPALLWHPQGERVPAYLLDSAQLQDHWSRLDAFEGDEYRREPIPFLADDGSWLVGQVYLASGRVSG